MSRLMIRRAHSWERGQFKRDRYGTLWLAKRAPARAAQTILGGLSYV